jgi:uncharacterized protein YkwD
VPPASRPVSWLASWRWIAAGGAGLAGLVLLVIAAASPHLVSGSGRPVARSSSVPVSPSIATSAPALDLTTPSAGSSPTPSSPSPTAAPPSAQPPPATVAPRTSTLPAAPKTTSAVPAAVPPPAGPVTEASYAAAVLSTLNSERAQNGLPPLSSNATLGGTARAHNLRMASANSMSHQLPSEAPLGDRITAAGYHWRSCGENIGWTTARTQSGIVAIEVQMYNETPPDDGHRLNILSASFTQVGVDVILDNATGKLWLTEDFGQPA